ncbi:uncharacterized protein BDW70DRAFT_162309 [Aspergillus foveolatus]|uniref:uncharacterized protein n=1 Tax=Aspergillus foveolatus TaxID=210207 RepID=UPI003CCDDD42
MGRGVQDDENGYNNCPLVDEMDTLSLFEPAQRPTHPSSSSTTNIPDEVLTRQSFYVLGDEGLSDALLEEGSSAVTDPYHSATSTISEESEASTIIASDADLIEGGDVELSSASQGVPSKHANPNGETQQAMDLARADHALFVAKPRWDDSVLDFTSSDFLSFNRTGRIREAFQGELSQYEDFRLSASGSRVQYGNYDYLI